MNIIIKYDLQAAPKTGDWKHIKPEVKAKKCIGCGTCVKFCPEATIELNENKKAEIDHVWCKGCGVCAEICPIEAILMKKN
jgi:pyruvate ferredoxin oxidoreductase delta subunit